jgi:hypothetical protein
MFRRLYWIAEQVDNEGRSRVTGVYTSIQDLVHRGLHWCEDLPGRTLRLTIIKPDTFNTPLGTWTSPDFDGLVDEMKGYVSRQEYTEEETAMLASALDSFIS